MKIKKKLSYIYIHTHTQIYSISAVDSNNLKLISLKKSYYVRSYVNGSAERIGGLGMLAMMKKMINVVIAVIAPMRAPIEP